MSVNLTLAFDRYGLKGPILCYERHRLDWVDYGLFARIKAEAVPLTEGVQWYDDDGLGETKEDCYGEPLTFMSAHNIARYLGTVPLRGFDAATLAYLKALPVDTRVVLWWN
jgi:hypothetical protein